MTTSLRILLVDDLPTNRIMMKAALGAGGYDFVEAGTGIEALAALKTETFDLVVLDYLMPGLSGMDVLRAIREETNEQVLPVMIVSGEEDEGAASEFIAAGANDYVTKPYDFSVLAARVKTLVGHKRALDEIRGLRS